MDCFRVFPFISLLSPVQCTYDFEIMQIIFRCLQSFWTEFLFPLFFFWQIRILLNSAFPHSAAIVPFERCKRKKNMLIFVLKKLPKKKANEKRENVFRCTEAYSAVSIKNYRHPHGKQANKIFKTKGSFFSQHTRRAYHLISTE